MTQPLRYLSALATLALLAATAFAPPAAHAQIVFDDFDDGDVSDVFTFSANGGAGIGVGTTEGAGGAADAALSVGINPADAGAFAGVVITGGEGVTDISAAEYITFYVRPTTVQAGNLPLVLEVNLQEDVDGDGSFDPAVEDEFQAVYPLDVGGDYTLVQIPVSTFTDDNTAGAGSDDGFEFENLLQVVLAFGGLQGPEFAFAIDDIVFRDEPIELADPVVEFDFFDDGDVSDVFTFSANGGAGIGVGTTEGAGGAADAALSVGINPADAGAFAGVVITGGEGVTDISAAEYITFYVRPTTVQAGNLPLVLEVNLQEDVDGDGSFDPAVEDEFQAVYSLTPGSDYERVIIPVGTFTDDNTAGAGADDGFEFENLLQVVLAFGGLQGPEFAFAIDELGFVNSATVVSNEGEGAAPERSFVSAAYPNPFNAQARFELTLDRAESVRVEVFDVLGRRVALVHEGRLAAETPHTFLLDGRRWVDGVYLYRVTGETFVETRRVVLTK